MVQKEDVESEDDAKLELDDLAKTLPQGTDRSYSTTFGFSSFRLTRSVKFVKINNSAIKNNNVYIRNLNTNPKIKRFVKLFVAGKIG